MYIGPAMDGNPKKRRQLVGFIYGAPVHTFSLIPKFPPKWTQKAVYIFLS